MADDDDDYVLVKWNGTEATSYCKHSRISIFFSNSRWIKVTAVKEILSILKEIGDDSYMLVAGNTAQGKIHTIK